MKSIKPGRGPSMMGGFMGIFAVLFGIVWTVLAAQASPVFALFGLLFVGIGITNTVYNFKNATGKNRYSAFDITDEHEEPDPLNQRFGDSHTRQSRAGSKFCPYCGTAVEGDFAFCNNCGKKLP